MAAKTTVRFTPLSILKKEFTAVGLKAVDVVRSLPEWAEEALAHPSGIHEVRGFVAKHYGLMVDADGTLRQRMMPAARFKTRSGADVGLVAPARALATSVAHAVAAVTTVRWRGVLPSADTLRKQCITAGRTWVGLDELLELCWGYGVPVIYLPMLPVNQSKMEGMVTFCGDRPVIVVTKKCSPAWMLFILGHEMGHLALGHLDGGTIVDETVVEGDIDDAQERDANHYALRLLTGEARKALSLARLLRAPSLVQSAITYGRQHHIDPGHVILNAVRNTEINGEQPWPLGNAALKLLNPDPDAVATRCRAFLREHVDMDQFSDDQFGFIERLGVI
ncbi:hypothetical protein [Azospirillum sp. TSO5]|uniref:hypothetical protein n=1 Tax=Azospirillum sp. TSO5 TaxID=716760 RepID=UPI0011B21910|nr:hypothetical protein [Azospirillum sp. TSO5]